MNNNSTIVHALDSLHENIGKLVGQSDWIHLNQDRINQFAQVTDDHQFIHVDPERAATSPFGQTIAHGMLTLSIIPAALLEHGLKPEGATTVINYGFEKVRFLQPVLSGQDVRVEIVVGAVDDSREGFVRVTYDVTVNIKDNAKPAAVASMILMYVLERQGAKT